MKKSGWKIILGVAVLVCVICLGRFGWVKYQDYKTEQARKATLKEIAIRCFNIIDQCLCIV